MELVADLLTSSKSTGNGALRVISGLEASTLSIKGAAAANVRRSKRGKRLSSILAIE